MINAGSLELNAPAQMNGGMERAQRLTQVRGAAATGLYLFYLLSFICQRGRRVAGGGGEAPPSSRLARRRRGY